MRPPRRADAADLDGARHRGGTEMQTSAESTSRADGDARPFAVFVKKATTGADVLFSRYTTRREADDVVQRLGEMHCRARVEMLP